MGTFDGDDNDNGHTGTPDADTAFGKAGSHQLSGGAGDDKIVVHTADFAAGDNYAGGAGADEFDVVADHGNDPIDLSTGIIGGMVNFPDVGDNAVTALTVAQVNAFTSIVESDKFQIANAGVIDLSAEYSIFIGTIVLSDQGNGFRSSCRRVRAVMSGSGAFLVQADVNGDGVADFSLLLDSPIPLIITDFALLLPHYIDVIQSEIIRRIYNIITLPYRHCVV